MEMETLKYKIIKTEKQYIKYCNILEHLQESGKKTRTVRDEIELLTFLIDKYDQENNTFLEADPVELLKSLMKEHKMKSVDLANLLNVSTGLVSDMLNYKKGLSKDTIRILSNKFKLSQEAFNRPYKLVGSTQQLAISVPVPTTNQAQELDLGHKNEKKIKPIVYHSFEEKEQIEKELLTTIPDEKRNGIAASLMSIFHQPARRKKPARKRSIKK